METKEALLIALLIALPATIVAAGFWYLRPSAAGKRQHKYYELRLWGQRIALQSTTLAQLGLLAFIFIWLDLILPFGLALLLLLLPMLGWATIRRLDPPEMAEQTKQLLARLSGMHAEIENVRLHVESLGQNVLARQTELDEKERLRQNLEALIKQKSEEAKAWEQMTPPQREVFVDAAVAAMSKESRGTFWWGLVLGFVINILATLAWTLLGNPGRDDIIKRFQEASRWFR